MASEVPLPTYASLSPQPSFADRILALATTLVCENELSAQGAMARNKMTCGLAFLRGESNWVFDFPPGRATSMRGSLIERQPNTKGATTDN